MISVYLDLDTGSKLRQSVNEDIDFSYKHTTETSKGNHMINLYTQKKKAKLDQDPAWLSHGC